MRVRLNFTLPEFTPLDVFTLHPARVLRLTTGEIERLPLILDRRQASLGDACRVSCSASAADELVLSGRTAWLKHAGWRLDGGRLVVEGSLGYGAGSEMSGGELEIHGDAGDCLGMAMHGGLIRLHGRAGDWCAASLPGQDCGMTGGTMLVDGDAGAFAGLAIRRGLVWIGGRAGAFFGERIRAGTILCAGDAGPHAGRGMQRGSLVAGRMAAPLPGFRSAGQTDAEWLRICFRTLKGMGVTIPPDWLETPPRRFTGDHLEMGKGEILVYDLIE